MWYVLRRTRTCTEFPLQGQPVIDAACAASSQNQALAIAQLATQLQLGDRAHMRHCYSYSYMCVSASALSALEHLCIQCQDCGSPRQNFNIILLRILSASLSLMRCSAQLVAWLINSTRISPTLSRSLALTRQTRCNGTTFHFYISGTMYNSCLYLLFIILCIWSLRCRGSEEHIRTDGQNKSV